MVESSQVQDPPFITYLLDPDQEYDCYFLVSHPELVKPVKIGAVRKMLLAHSEVMRLQLQDSKLAERGIVPILVDDLYPDTFKNLLKYIYGYDLTADLTFDEADNLLYAAEKYIMETLKNKLAVRLMSLLSFENICILLNNPACYRHMELESVITEILQSETLKVLNSPQFVSLTSEGLLNILKQGYLNAPEIEVWKAALRWAQHKAGSNDGEELRQTLIQHLKHIRFCTMTPEDVCKEIAPARVLNSSEIELVCVSVGRKEEQPQLTEICNTIDCRAVMVTNRLSVDLGLALQDERCFTFMVLKSKDCKIKDLWLGCKGKTYEQDRTYQIECAIMNIEMSSPKKFSMLNYTKQVTCDEEFLVPVVRAGDPPLMPNTLIVYVLAFSEQHPMFSSQSNISYSNNYFSIKLLKFQDYYRSPFNKIVYTVEQ